ncbi:MAG: ThiF family adenylyltransferase [Rubrobacteraceae bacterium]|nr:ThiF family adenylyltransferase [Rubrobacteraceae bacterium]
MVEVGGPSEELLAARRSLEGLEGLALMGNWEWREDAAGPSEGRWVLRCRLSPSVDPAGPIPASTDWYVLVDAAYPWGSVKFYPAQEGGISRTFPHQNSNRSPMDGLPWRMGDICIGTQVRVLGRRAYDAEPYGVEERLRWRFDRALAWLEAASRDELLLPGEPFELPQVLPAGGLEHTIAFQEGPATLGVWADHRDRAGLVDLFKPDPDKSIFLVDRFLSAGGQPIRAPGWGKAFEDPSKERIRGVWVRLDGVPVLYPWQNPATWGELREAFWAQGRDLDRLLAEVAHHVRDGRTRPLLIGFPIPERVGGPSRRMHWYAAWLPALSWGDASHAGFRPGTEPGYRMRDRAEVLVDSHPIGWQTSENWHADDVSSRGRLPEDLRSREILLVGAGAIGSAVAELLVRGGVRKLLVVDGQWLEIGNLVRHSLGLDALHEQKAPALARRLNLASPHAHVGAIDGEFPPSEDEDRDKILRCDTVLDCTGEDSVLRHLQLFPWKGERLFASLSLGFGAERLFCFVSRSVTFPLDDYRGAIDPHLRWELERYPEAELPREGAGCWHPLFPARIDDLWPMAAAAVKVLERAAAEPLPEPSLEIFERFEEDGVFAGIRRADYSTAR